MNMGELKSPKGKILLIGIGYNILALLWKRLKSDYVNSFFLFLILNYENENKKFIYYTIFIKTKHERFININT